MLKRKNTFGRSLLVLITILIVLFFVFFSDAILKKIGSIIVLDEKPPHSEAVIVLNTGIEYYPRLIQASDLFRNGLARMVVINGNRKTDTLRELEAKGFESCCPWYSDSVRILAMLGVPEKYIIRISAEDVFDSVSEAEILQDFTIPPLRQNLGEVLAEFDHQVFLKIEVGDRIIGSVRCYLEDRTCHVGKLIVHPDHQNRGLGTRLLLAAETQFPNAGRYVLFTSHRSVKNLHLYTRCGYRPFERRTLSEKITLVYMEKPNPWSR